MNTKLLENIGFTKGEIKVYFALLELGNTTTGPIITKSTVARSKVYEILERLKLKGLVTDIIQGKLKYFQASHPNKILDYIKRKEQQLKNEEDDFKKILPELIEKQKYSETKQESKVYVGTEGIRTFFDELVNQLERDDEYLAMTIPWKGLIGKSPTMIFQNFHLKRAEKKIKAKILTSDKTLANEEKVNFSKTGYYEFKTTNIQLPTGIGICKDYVITFNWGETPRAFVIECKENAEHYKKFFYDIWKKSK
ncbi:MAG: hypothetical protein KKF89_01035 [Nanoarchaeota archaeon]|nr:hypothetical protein [Nanoarchaeota archaeon]MBU1854282.1 hypothetical protein [Nanoarchaeota archaeon]